MLASPERSEPGSSAEHGSAPRGVHGEDIWVLHAFRKKATQGIKTRKKDLYLIRERLNRLKREL